MKYSRHMKTKFAFISAMVSLILWILSLQTLSAQQGDKHDFSLFDSEEMLHISLKFDITKFMKDKSLEEYLDAELVYYINESDSLVNKIRLRARGNSRIKFCNFPPVRLNFKNCDNPPIDLEGISNLKLISHCATTNMYKEYLQKEYLAYKLYNVVSEQSFRVRLLRINYIDTGKKGYNKQLYGALIEPLDLLSKRLKAVEKEDIVVRSAFIEPGSLDILCLFQYLIGNEDWFLANLHNLKLIDLLADDSDLLYAIPYDFDCSGLVNAVYAVPNERVGLESIMDRIYSGPCRSDEEFRKATELFLSKKDEFYTVINSCEQLSEKTRKKLSKYLDTFFAQYKRDLLLIKMKKTCAESKN